MAINYPSGEKEVPENVGVRKRILAGDCGCKLRITFRAFCCADSPCYCGPVPSLIKYRKLMAYSKLGYVRSAETAVD